MQVYKSRQMLQMKKLIITSFLIGITLIANAQDNHFSQFYAAPMTVNPALTGLFDGKYRGIVNYRTQWNSILNTPFVTKGASGDANFAPFKRSKYPDKIGVGVQFFSDKVGAEAFSTVQVGLSGAFHKALDYKGTQVLSAGYQLNIVQRTVNYNQLTFNDEFDGLTGYSLGTQENLPRNNVSYADMSAGVFYSAQANDKVQVYIGAGIHHFNSPDASFYESPDIQPDNIFTKYTLQGGARYRFSPQFDIEPRFIVFVQGPHIEANIGANARIALDDYATQNLYVGGWIRPVSDVDGEFSLDAFVLMGAYRYNNVQLGMSYDVNMSNLASSTNGRGGFELSLSVLGFYENDNVLCPQF